MILIKFYIKFSVPRGKKGWDPHNRPHLIVSRK